MIMDRKDMHLEGQEQGQLDDQSRRDIKQDIQSEDNTMTTHGEDGHGSACGAIGGEEESVEDENQEPRRPSESSDMDYDSAFDTGDCVQYENRLDTNFVKCYQETCPPSTQQIAELTYRRDTLEMELTRCNTRLHNLQQPPTSPKVTISCSLQGVEQEALEVIEEKIEDFKANMASYGVVVETHPGCVVIRLKIETKDQLEKLRIDYKSGVLQGVLCEWLKAATGTSNSGEDIEQFEVEISTERITELTDYFEAEMLVSPIHFTYCDVNKNWYWSPDLKWWHSIYVYQVKGGEYHGHIPQAADIELMDKLKLPDLISAHHSSKPCILCELKYRHPQDPHPKPICKVNEINVKMRWYTEERQSSDLNTAAENTFEKLPGNLSHNAIPDLISDTPAHTEYGPHSPDQESHSTEDSDKDIGIYDIS